MKVFPLDIPDGGRCFVVGDVAGHFGDLSKLVNQLGLSPRTDKLVLNGNFLGYSPSSRQALAWLEKDWVLPVLGRHEACILEMLRGREAPSLAGQWMEFLSDKDRASLLSHLEALPVALEARFNQNHVVVSHCPLSHSVSWNAKLEELDAWSGPTDKIFTLFEGRLLGLGAMGQLKTDFPFKAFGEPMSLSSFHVERPSAPLLRNGRYAFLVGSSHMSHGGRYEHPCMLPFVELTTLNQSSDGDKIWQGSLVIAPR